MSSIKQITLPDGNTYDFKDEVSGYIKDTGVYGIYYGTCTTAAATAAKVATLDNSDGFSLTKGVTVAIKFTHYNKIANPTLNVDGSGAKSIKRYGTTAPSTSATSSWNDNSVLILVYDGTYWQLANWLNTTYSAMSVAEYESGTSGTARLISPVNLKNAIQHWATGEANVQSDWNQTDDTADDYIKNKPTIPSGVSPYTSNPSMDGTASAGSSNLFSRGDHVHPSDTSRVPTTRKINGQVLSSDVTLNGSQIPLKSTGNLTIAVAVDNKVDKETGKGLSTNDYTTTEKDKLAGIATGAEVNVQADWNESDTTSDAYIQNKPTVPTKTSELTNDSGFIAEEADPTVPAWAKASTKPAYTASEIRYNAQVTVAQEFNNKVDKETGKGLSTNDYTTAEKNKLAGIAEGAEVNVNADWNATSGDAQILNKPTIPSKTSDLTNDSGFITGYTETDPAFTASPAYGITAQNITSWNNKVNKSGDVGLGDMMFQTGSGIGLKFQGDNVDKVVRLNGFGGAAGYNLYFRGFDVGVSGNNPVSLLNIADPTSEQGAATKKYVDDNKFSGSYTDLTDKPIYFGTCSSLDTDTVKVVTLSGVSNFSLDAGVRIAVQFTHRHNGNSSRPQLNVNNTGAINVCFGDSNQIPSDERLSLCGWNRETVLFEYSGLNWVMLTSSFAVIQLYNRDMQRADWDETDASSLSYIVNKPNVPVRVYGTTQTITPTEVKEALSDGNIVEIVHEDQTFSFLTFFSFNYSWAFGMLISNTLVDYQGSTYLYTLIGNINNDSWSGSATSMAKLSDIPTIPTNVSAFTNDAGYITGYTETDPTVPAWAKASSKPSYGADEISFDNTQQTQYLGNATNVNTALTSLDYALDNAEHDINNISSDYFSKSGGTIKGDVTLYVASGNSPGLIFQRGTLTDNYNDWKIYDKGGYLYFAQRGSGSSSFNDMGYISTTGVLTNFTIPWESVTGKPTQLPTVTSSDNGKVLRVVDGAWSAVALPSASGVSF